MSIRNRYVLSREKRLTTISHFDGKLSELLNELSGHEIRQRVRTLTQDSESELIAAIHALSQIKDTVLVVHGAVGCSVSAGFFAGKEESQYWYSTNLKERDTILGGDNKLRETVLRAYEETDAKAILVVGTPVIAINNDDVTSILMELEDEIGAKCIFINVDGFKTKASVNGYDVVSHALAKYIVEPYLGEKENFVNVISFSETKEEVLRAVEILKAVGVAANVVGAKSSYHEIRKAARARASVTLDDDEGGYLAERLEETYAVKYIQTDSLIGIRGTRHFLWKLEKGLNGQLANSQILISNAEEISVATFIEKRQNAIKRDISQKILSGHRVFLHTSIQKAKVYAVLIQELGGEIAGIAVPTVAPSSKEKLEALLENQPGLSVVVGQGQPYELLNVINKTDADLYMSDRGSFRFLEKAQVQPVSLNRINSVGYLGVIELHQQLEKIFLRRKNQEAVEDSEYAASLVYKPSWLKKSSNWYVKQEVR